MSFVKNNSADIDALFEILRVHVKEKFDIDVESIDELRNRSRKRPLVYFRRMFMVILFEGFNKNYNQDEIASVVGLDRTSLIYHTKMHHNEYTRYNDYKEEYDSIRDSFFEKIGIE